MFGKRAKAEKVLIRKKEERRTALLHQLDDLRRLIHQAGTAPERVDGEAMRLIEEAAENPEPDASERQAGFLAAVRLLPAARKPACRCSAFRRTRNSTGPSCPLRRISACRWC